MFVVLTVCLVLGHTGRLLTEAAFVLSGGETGVENDFQKSFEKSERFATGCVFPRVVSFLVSQKFAWC